MKTELFTKLVLSLKECTDEQLTSLDIFLWSEIRGRGPDYFDYEDDVLDSGSIRGNNDEK